MIPYLLFYKIVQLFIFMLLGFLIVKLKLLKSEDAAVLSKISIYILMPAAIISAYDVEVTEAISSGLVLAFGAAFLIHLLLLLVDLIYKKTLRPSGAERASAVYSNAGNIIIPLVSFILGSEWIIYTTAFLSVQLLFLFTHGERLFKEDKSISIKKIILNPNILAIAAGLIMILSSLRLPSIVGEVADALGSMVGTVGMLIAGMAMASVDFGAVFKTKSVYICSAVRMLVCPLLVFVLLKGILALPFLSIENAESILLISYLAAMTPAAATITQFSKLYKSGEDISVSINALTTLLGILTMPLFVMLFQL
ncbi:MAG: AEC family transporter [Clostridia bacterium]|nr:AEC family transporter [Clostridia bacterium]